MLKTPWTAAVAAALGVAAVIGCTNLNYNCAGICGTTAGNGEFEGVINAASNADALQQCLTMLGCDAGFQPTCSCYLQE